MSKRFSVLSHPIHLVSWQARTLKQLGLEVFIRSRSAANLGSRTLKNVLFAAVLALSRHSGSLPVHKAHRGLTGMGRGAQLPSPLKPRRPESAPMTPGQQPNCDNLRLMGGNASAE